MVIAKKQVCQPAFCYIKCPIHRYTFSVKQIRNWLEENCRGLTLNLFAGRTRLSIHEVRNDIDPSAPADYHLDALEFVTQWKGPKFDCIILDPPYSLRKSMEFYEGRTVSAFQRLKKLLPGILNKGGRIITFGYHSSVMGKSRGFHIDTIALFSHGGAIHDTIATVEIYLPIDNDEGFPLIIK